MTSEKLDELILSIASPRWQKVAMIIARVAHDEHLLATDSEDQLALIADRIGHLVTEGQLAAQGDISNWRHSEVRLVT
jgi:hypothetical protein